MQTLSIDLMPGVPGNHHTLQVLRFGTPGIGPKAYIQAALHADEVPAMLVAHALKRQLQVLEERGLIRGEIVLVPFANPIGLAQNVLGMHQGRFDLKDGGNFNRNYADIAPAALALLEGMLGADPEQNQRLVRDALRQAVSQLPPALHPVQDLKNKLLQWAIDSDIMLDLHCDHEAIMHIYALTPQQQQAADLGALLGAEAILLATESGDSPFDEACSRPWLQLQRALGSDATPLPLGCFSATVELRGETDTCHQLAEQDAAALVNFLTLQGVIRSTAPVIVPALRCAPTLLAASEPLTAPAAGVVVFHCKPGDTVTAGTRIADLVNPETGAVTTVVCASSGVLYARNGGRWAGPGKRLGKIAGTTLVRTGKLLSP